jgi:hypothetical protein
MPSVELGENEYKRRFRAQFADRSNRNAARTLLEAVQARRTGRLVSAGNDLDQPRQK